MTTFAELTDDTLTYLHGFTTMQEQATYLSADVASSDLTLPLGDATAVSRGLVEIGNELVMIDSVDTSASTATAPPYGRGYRSSTAEAHLSGTRVASAPLFPRALVRKALNDAVQAIFPDVSAVGTTTFTFNPAISTYALPAGAQSIIGVAWQTIGPSLEWLPIRRYRIDSMAPTAAWPTGSSISLYDAIVPGRTVQVVYFKQPTPLALDADVFTTVTGLPASCEDVIRLGAAYRMIPFLDAPHLSGLTAEADFSANQRQYNSATSVGKYLLQMYQMRLADETAKQQALYPARSHYTR